MPSVPQRNQKPQERMCPVCGGPADRAKPKGSVPCRGCGGAMEDSPVGKQALQAASAQRMKQVDQQRQGQRPGVAQPGMQRPGLAGPGAMGRPGMGAPQAQPQIDPQAVAQFITRLRGGR